MNRRQLIGAGAALLGTSTILYSLFAPVSDEEKARRLLDDLGDALSFSEPIVNVMFHGAHLSDRFEDIFTESVRIQVSEVSRGIPDSRGQLGLAAAKVFTRYGSLDVSFALDELSVQGDVALCKATATVTANSSNGLQSDSRPVEFTLVRDGGGFLIEAALVRRPR